MPTLKPKYLSFLFACFLAGLLRGQEGLRVSADGTHLEHTNGEPFFYLGDTAWELLHRTTEG